ncbi:reticulon-4-interacting protein 1, mitochondrial-like [Cotesia glomerata]|uniref:Enoyl reductase (ER) domain-containing protein n=1 Tax=Cotesia glomerata TaxID=32391 RepID=A0AAV7I0Y4_COTGL|nr:reticulon-4-interacting protein 1, mitochondrial-like [Cotesia glomerata]KAH0540056.1 hypothetical protein KQX54_011870 [Cotesia glomerata]
MLSLRIFKCSKTHNKWYIQNVSNLSINIIKRNKSRIQAWQIHAYGNLDEINLSTIRMPIISKPSEVIVKVEASSVNPIDISMIGGYGSKVLNFMRKIRKMNGEIEFPLTMGRDFSGVIIAKGHNVGEKLKLGDEVWGVVPVEQQGCHATHVIVDNNLVRPKPSNLSSIEAASILYAGLTAWSALWFTGGLFYKTLGSNKYNRKVLILGGSGGVGSVAIQMAKTWNLKVISTCSSDAVDQLKKLGADIVINYKDQNADQLVTNEGIYDIILDCSNQGIEKINSKKYRFKSYIALNSPLLKNIDNYGLIGGAMNIVDLLKYNIPKKKDTSCVKWGFFIPSTTGLNALQKLVENEQLKPVLEEIYTFDKLPEAYKRVAEGHLRGKVVIDMKA